MNKDEMIKDLANILRNACKNTPFDYCMSHECEDCRATTAINAGYRKVGEDEIVVKRSEVERLKNLEINYELVYEDYRKLEQERKGRRLVADNQIVFTAHELCNEFGKHRKETARAILTTIYNRLRYATFRQTAALKIVKDVANALGIELE